MNDSIRWVGCALGFVTAAVGVQSAEKAGSAGGGDRMRVITSTADGAASRQAAGPPGTRHEQPAAMETVPFLGVHTVPATATLAAQLDLPKGAGLVVAHVVSDSPAAGILQPHDILLHFDDQLLVETRQLSTLIRQRSEGEEVTLTYVRGGKKATARVKLAKREVAKTAGVFEPGAAPGAYAFGFGPGEVEVVRPSPDISREEVDRVLSLIQRASPGGPPRVLIERRAGPGFRATSINTANSNLVCTDSAGSLELTIKDGIKTLVAKDPTGKQLFAGPVNTPEERDAMPPAVRERLDKLEGMHRITFETDGEFKGAEIRILHPRASGISAPLPPAPPRPPVL
jgi:serine protease Do